MTDPPRMISVFRDGRGCIGFVLGSCRGYLALNADGQPVPGHFDSKEAAVEAIVSKGIARQRDGVRPANQSMRITPSEKIGGQSRH